MRDIKPVFELLENEDITVGDAEKFIKAIVERGESPVLPEGTGRLRICSACSEVMASHDTWDRCPGSLHFNMPLSVAFPGGEG